MIAKSFANLKSEENSIVQDKVKYLFLFNLMTLFICLISFPVAIYRNTLSGRPGLFIMTVTSSITLVLLLNRKPKYAFVFSSFGFLLTMTVGAFFGTFHGHEGIYFPTIIIFFLLFTSLRVTSFTILYNFSISIAIYFIKRKEHGLDLKFLIDNMIALSLFSGMALIVVHVFEKHIKKIEAQKDKLAEFLSSEKELSNLLLHQPNSFIHSASEEEVSLNERKYAKSGLKADEVKEIIHKLLKYMEEEKPYLNENLKITDLANELKVSKNNLSQAINDGLGKNFYTFLNSYRINEFIHKIKKEEYSYHSILRIAMDCGFNSKSSFNFTFKKITGLSPRVFKTRNIDSNQ